MRLLKFIRKELRNSIYEYLMGDDNARDRIEAILGFCDLINKNIFARLIYEKVCEVYSGEGADLEIARQAVKELVDYGDEYDYLLAGKLADKISRDFIKLFKKELEK